MTELRGATRARHRFFGRVNARTFTSTVPVGHRSTRTELLCRMRWRREEQEAIGRRIKRQRLRLGMTQADLAVAVGKSQGWLSKVEKGARHGSNEVLVNMPATEGACGPEASDTPLAPPPPRTSNHRLSPTRFPSASHRFDAGDPRSIGLARQFVPSRCDAWSIDGDACDGAALIASELATNALVHSGSTEFDVTLSLASTEYGIVLCVEVADRGPWLWKEPAAYDEFAECGRGTTVVCVRGRVGHRVRTRDGHSGLGACGRQSEG